MLRPSQYQCCSTVDFISSQSAAQMLKEAAKHMALALKFCHEIGIAHRDVKPENLLLFKNGERNCFKLADFGAAALTKYEPPPPTVAQPTLRRMVSSRPIGSTQFVPPEVACLIYAHTHHQPRPDIKYDAYAVDVWSFGVALFHMAAGEAPFAFAHWSDPGFVAFCSCTGQNPGRDHSFASDSSASDPAAAAGWRWPQHFDLLLRQLLEICMQVDPKQRVGIHAVCQHDWFGHSRQSSSGIVSVDSSSSATSLEGERKRQRQSVSNHAELAWLDTDADVIRVPDSPVLSEFNAGSLRSFAPTRQHSMAAAGAGGNVSSPSASPLHPALQVAIQQASDAANQPAASLQQACHSHSQSSMLRTDSMLSPGGSFISTTSSARQVPASLVTNASSASRLSTRFSSASSGRTLLRHQSMRSSYASLGSMMDSHILLPPIEQEHHKDDASNSSQASSSSPQLKPHTKLPSLPASAEIDRSQSLRRVAASSSTSPRANSEARQLSHSISAPGGEHFGPIAGSADVRPAGAELGQPPPSKPPSKKGGLSSIRRLFGWD